ncbi:hypothetical protein [Streptomyces sp. NPDC091215]|uniref:hypothetical protein n=1 Tax=Streptomyces sp. NPDC091215 TaxID=3155192 RepID=UPI00341B7764
MTETPQPPRRPGEWPVPRTFLPAIDGEHEYADLRNHAASEQARWTVTLGAICSHLECPHCHPAPGMDHQELSSIRAHLAEQPTPRAVRAAARHWTEAVTQLADEVITSMRNQERGQ